MSALLPFEARTPGFWRRVAQTLRLACTAPLEGYAALPGCRGLAAPWRFKLLLAAPGYAGVLLGLGLLQLMVTAAAWAGQEPLPPASRWLLPALALALALLGPALQFLAMVAGGALLHALLWAFRGTRNSAGLRQTIRATGYTQALLGLTALAPLLAIPAWPASKVALGLGLGRLHRTEPWRGLAAVLAQALLTGLAALILIGVLVFGWVRRDQKARQISLPAPEMVPVPLPHRPDLI